MWSRNPPPVDYTYRRQRGACRRSAHAGSRLSSLNTPLVSQFEPPAGGHVSCPRRALVGSGSLFGVLLNLKGLFVLRKNVVPRGSRSKQNSQHTGSCADAMSSRDYREAGLLLCCDKKCWLRRTFESVDIVMSNLWGGRRVGDDILCIHLNNTQTSIFRV